MQGSIWRLLGWMVLPFAIVVACVLFTPFAISFAFWALAHPETAGTLLFIVLAVYYLRRAVQAVSILWGLMFAKRQTRKAVREISLQAVQSAVAR